MILLCGGEGAAGVETGGVFFLLVSYRGRSGRGGHRRVEAAAQQRAARGLRSDGPAIRRANEPERKRTGAALHLV